MATSKSHDVHTHRERAGKRKPNLVRLWVPILIGLGAGIALGIPTGLLYLWIPLFVAVGIGFGLVWSQKR